MLKRITLKEGLGRQLRLDRMVFMRDWDISDIYLCIFQSNIYLYGTIQVLMGLWEMVGTWRVLIGQSKMGFGRVMCLEKQWSLSHSFTPQGYMCSWSMFHVQAGHRRGRSRCKTSPHSWSRSCSNMHWSVEPVGEWGSLPALGSGPKGDPKTKTRCKSYQVSARM